MLKTTPVYGPCLSTSQTSVQTEVLGVTIRKYYENYLHIAHRREANLVLEFDAGRRMLVTKTKEAVAKTSGS
jgi:hypothetical protein